LGDKARINTLAPDDFAGATITLTNPGTIGTVASVPRLMKGQGSIIATGAIRTIGGAKVMTITSTYDHRIIQGAESGNFLRRLDGLLQGDDNFYGAVFESLGITGLGARDSGIGTATARALPSPEPLAPSPDLKHVAAAMALVKAIRNFGHHAARAAHGGRDARALPAQGVSRAEALLHRRTRRARADARPDGRARRDERSPPCGAGHGAPRSVERAGPHRGTSLRDHLCGVRRRATRRGDAHTRRRHRRREVSPRRGRRVPDRRREAREHHAH